MAPLNPATVSLIASGVGTLANLGAGYFGAKDARKAQKENERRAAMSNLIRSFGVDHRPEISQPMPGKATQILSGIGKAATAVSRLAGAADAIQDVTTRRAREKLQDKAAQLTLDQAKGQLAASSMPQVTRADLINRIQDKGDFSYFDQAPLEGLSKEAQQYARAAAMKNMSDEEARRLANRTAEAKLELIKAQTQAEGMADSGQLGTFSGYGEAIGADNPTLTWEDAKKTSEYIAALKRGGVDAFRTGFLKGQTTGKNRMNADELSATRGVNEVMKTNRHVTQSVDVQNFAIEALNAAGRQDAVGDIALVKAIAKITDPGSVVQLQEAKSVEETMGALGKFSNMYAKLIEGKLFNPKTRKALLEQALASYEGRRITIDNLINSTAEAWGGTANLTVDDYRRKMGAYKVKEVLSNPAVDKRLIDRLNKLYENKIDWTGQPFNPSGLLSDDLFETAYDPTDITTWTDDQLKTFYESGGQVEGSDLLKWGQGD